MLTLIRCPFHPRVTAVARKRPWSFCQKCRWQVTPKHAYTLDPSKSEWADYAAVQAECGSLSRNELTRNSSGNTRLQSSQLAEPLWTNPGLQSKISLRGLISTSKKKKKAQAGNESSDILPKSSHVRKTTTTTTTKAVIGVFTLVSSGGYPCFIDGELTLVSNGQCPCWLGKHCGMRCS